MHMQYLINNLQMQHLTSSSALSTCLPCTLALCIRDAIADLRHVLRGRNPEGLSEHLEALSSVNTM